MQNIFSFVKNSSSLSLRGFEKSEVIHSIYNFFKNWIATPLLRSARNDNYFYSSLRGIGNAEAIKFTFDSLSRKIKNPCLVIKKNLYQKEIFKMKILKTKKLFTYMVVGALVMALSISCKSNEEPQETGSTTSNHPSQGTYTSSYGSDSATVTINNNGTCTITGIAHFTSGSTTESADFSITVTKWWYNYPTSGNNTILYQAGSSWEKSEATINSPATDFFYVSYSSSGELSISFGPEGKRYWTWTLTKQ